MFTQDTQYIFTQYMFMLCSVVGRNLWRRFCIVGRHFL